MLSYPVMMSQKQTPTQVHKLVFDGVKMETFVSMGLCIDTFISVVCLVEETYMPN